VRARIATAARGFARIPGILALAFAAMAAAFPASAGIGYEGARHLLNRVGFGATDSEIAASAGLTRVEAVDRILAATRTEASVAAPAFVNEAFVPYYKLRGADAAQRKAMQQANVEQGFELREWWLREILLTPSPLTERMTIFWHNHFATSQQKVKSAKLLYTQNVLLRSQALGNFATLLHAVSKDPAMLVYLDNANSRRQAPNENFAREVMELFTLGEGHYAEGDIKEAARAFTGWSIDRDSGRFLYRPFFHDTGMKTVFGKSGRFDGDDVLNILLARRETAEFVTRKLWREFVSPQPDEAQVKQLAGVFRDARYEIKPLLRAILLSDAFWAPENRATLIKSPVELVAGTLHTLDIHPLNLRPAVAASALLGQNLMSPPNVKGWPGGESWITSATLLGRKQFLDRLFRGTDTAAAPAMAAVADDMKSEAAAGPEARARRMMERGLQTYAFDWDRWSRTLARGSRMESLMLATAAVNPVPPDVEGPELVRFLVSDPTYQLK
jgi:uncharacterized protein (DUF1800 family)